MVRARAAEDVVLIVDDDVSIREAVELALQLEGYATAVAGDGAEALRWLQRHAAPRLILLDLMMPGMDGWELFEQLADDCRLAPVPVVVMTAFGSDLGSVGQLPVLKKPLELRDLLRAVARHSWTAS